MAESFIQLPDDGTGKMVRSFEVTVGANSVHSQASTLVDAAGNEIGNYSTCTDEVSSSLVYSGKAAPGTATSAPAWQIKRTTLTGTVYATTWADGDTDFDNIWDNRASLSYS